MRAVRTKVASALIGTALVDVTQGNLRIEANKWNKRPVDPSGVRQLKRDVSVDGVDVTKDRMIFAVDRKDVVNIEKLPHLYNGLGPRPPMLDLATSGGRLYLIQGGHRRSVATDLTAEYQKDLREAQARNASESALEQYKERISRVQYWPCDLYDYGELRFQASCDYAPILYDAATPSCGSVVHPQRSLTHPRRDFFVRTAHRTLRRPQKTGRYSSRVLGHERE